MDQSPLLLQEIMSATTQIVKTKHWCNLSNAKTKRNVRKELPFCAVVRYLGGNFGKSRNTGWFYSISLQCYIQVHVPVTSQCEVNLSFEYSHWLLYLKYLANKRR